MRDGVIYDCVNYGVCGTVGATGKCSKACIERREKEIGKPKPLPFDCPVCGHKTNMPQTNADRIRAMTDEELAKLIVKQLPMYLWPNGLRTIYFDMDNHNKDNAVKAWLKWLQQPAEGD